MLELRHLRYAIAVAEEGHMTRAAERLGIQQPPLSQQIKSLETMIGTPLFRRLPRGVELTDAGTAFIEKARSVLSCAEEAVEAARRAARGETGQLQIGFTSSAAFHSLVSSVFRSLRIRHSELSLTLDEGATSELVEAINAGRLDAAFIRTNSLRWGESLITELLDEEDMVLAMPDDHVLARQPDEQRIALASLSAETFVLYRRPSSQVLYDTIIASCRRAGFSPHLSQETPKLVSTLSLVAAGLGLTIIPQSMARLETSGVTYRRFMPDSGLSASLYLAYRREPLQGALQRFVEETRLMAGSGRSG